MYKILLIGLAGLLGTLARYSISVAVDHWWNGSFPAGTFLVNMAGCLAIGFLVHAIEEKYIVDPAVQSALIVGFLGGFTTFSSFAAQSFNFLRGGQLFLATANILLSNLGGLLFVWAGYAVWR
jgi:CrcB protein